MAKLTEEMSQKYGFTLAEMERIKDITLDCWNKWDSGTLNKSEIVDLIMSKTEGNTRMGVLVGMSTGAMMESRGSESKMLLDALRKIKEEMTAVGEI